MIDDYNKYGHIYLISHKSEAISCFKAYVNLVESQLDKKINVLIIDQGHEYLFNELKTLCDEIRIEHLLFIPHTSQQNIVVEGRDKALLDILRTMIV